jgi:protein O-mannosyl-transferase
LSEVSHASSPKDGPPPQSQGSVDFFSRHSLILLALLLTFSLYARTLSYPFVFDDTMQIVGNRHIMYSGYVHAYFTQDVWSHMPGKHLDGYYRPLLLLWFRLNYLLFGDSSSLWHLSTVLVHLLGVILVYLLALKFVPDRITAFLAAALFAVHPIQVEAAAWVSGVNGSLCAVCILAAFLCYLEFKQSDRYLWLAASLASFALALLAKESAIPFAGVILAYEWSLGSKRYRWAGAYLLVSIGYWIARAHALSAPLPAATGRPWLPALLSLPWLLCIYARMLVLPNKLAVFYDFDYVQRLSDARFWLPIALIASAFFLLRRSKRAIFLTAWFLLFLSPAFAYVYVSMSGETYNGRHLYLPSVAFCIALAAAARRLRARTVVVVFILALVPITWTQIRYWANSRRLFEHTYEVSPTSYLAAATYMDQLIPERQYGEALEVGHAALSHHPGEPVLIERMAQAEFLDGQYPAAAADFAEAAANSPTRPDIWFRLGFSYLYIGRNAEAVHALRRAVQLDDGQAAYHYELGIALANLGQRADAIVEVGKAVDLAGDSQVGQAYAPKLKLLQTSAVPSVKPGN